MVLELLGFARFPHFLDHRRLFATHLPIVLGRLVYSLVVESLAHTGLVPGFIVSEGQVPAVLVLTAAVVAMDLGPETIVTCVFEIGVVPG